MNLSFGQAHPDKLTLDYVSTGENILPKHLSKDLAQTKSEFTSSSSKSVWKVKLKTAGSL
jgi:uncharacterized phage infection (PIP) family protein YhgE